ncbi:MAG: nicotinate-nucleotide adenylyltransferase [Phormidesmis sp. CAN_BIN44]|nr:nicotinate-nucleotide adenylyltransferase [Phormidesmis sp. CAN_BIN44]
MLRVALFGTSADPPTRGHLAILCWLSQHFDQVAVWASDNPFKSHQTALDHRTAMLRLLIGDLDLRNIQVYPELSNSRTVITVERAQEHWQGAEFTLVVGSDLVRQLPKWFRARDLLDRVKLLVVPRPGYSITDSELDPLRQIGADVTIADLNAPNVSSTAYREQGETEGVTSPIQAYIDREQLYRCHARREKLPTY